VIVGGVADELDGTVVRRFLEAVSGQLPAGCRLSSHYVSKRFSCSPWRLRTTAARSTGSLQRSQQLLQNKYKRNFGDDGRQRRQDHGKSQGYEYTSIRGERLHLRNGVVSLAEVAESAYFRRPHQPRFMTCPIHNPPLMEIRALDLSEYPVLQQRAPVLGSEARYEKDQWAESHDGENRREHQSRKPVIL